MDRLVTLPEGRLLGTVSEGVAVWKGVPFAQPPVGELRFAAPRPVLPWDGIRDATDVGPRCPQDPLVCDSVFYQKEFRYETAEPMDEDCLYLNIWAPADAKACPVAVWIHGGAFDHGSGAEVEFDGTAFARKGIVLVSVNYRLGILGFFCHPELTARDGRSGNYGLLDQQTALRWVREHIEAFGGDPRNVTVFGQSAGGMSVQCLLCSPLAEGMADRAIIQSARGYGSGLLRFPSLRDQERSFASYLKKLGIGLEDVLDMTWQAVYELGQGFLEDAHANGQPGLRFLPVIDGYVLPCSTDEAVDGGRLARIPCMIGCTKDDIMTTPENAAHPELQPVYRASGDWCLRLDALGVPAYDYYFTRDLPGDGAGAFHSSELWYVFGTIDACWRPMTAEDRALSA